MNENRTIPTINQYWRHWKGTVYKIIGLAINQTDLDKVLLVIYGDFKCNALDLLPVIAIDTEKEDTYYLIEYNKNNSEFKAKLIDVEFTEEENLIFNKTKKIFARPLNMFMDTVYRPEYSGKRFTRVG